DHGLARVPGLAALPRLPLPRRHDARGLTGQVDARGLAEAVAVHVLGQAVDTHVVGELVVVVVDRARDRIAQVDPAGGATGVAIAAALPGNEELAGGEHPALGRAHAAIEPGQGHEGLHDRTR